MARTKIVATIGPASSSAETIGAMIEAGMNVARVNFSHGDHDAHRATVARLRAVAEAMGATLAILGDLQGPKIRLGNIASEGIPLKLDEEVMLTPRRGQPAMIHLPNEDLIAALRPGSRLVIGDGEVELTVVEKQGDVVRGRVSVAGLLESRKGVNAPGTPLALSSITEKDREDLSLICELALDYIALSFVRSPEDIAELRALIDAKTELKIPIIAKIEKSEAIEELEAIALAADGMMVARGDLGIDMPPQEVPILQKRIIRMSNKLGKPVITATQMLQSMVDHPRPTRAEASDVANAILDGTDAVMLSGETASGSFPVRAVQMMKNISEITEKEFPFSLWRQRRQDIDMHQHVTVTEAISEASCSIAEEVEAAAIVSTTMSGYTARQIARHRPHTAVVAVSPLPRTQRRLALVWGVTGVIVPNFVDTDSMVMEAVKAVRSIGFKPGDRLVITAGVPFGQTGQTNLIQVHEV